jgi:hypothetical protein
VAPDSSRMNVFRKMVMMVSLVTLERDATLTATLNVNIYCRAKVCNLKE